MRVAYLHKAMLGWYSTGWIDPQGQCFRQSQRCFNRWRRAGSHSLVSLFLLGFFFYVCVISCPPMNSQLSISPRPIKISGPGTSLCALSYDIFNKATPEILAICCKQKSKRHHSIRMCVPHNFSCGRLLVTRGCLQSVCLHAETVAA